MANKLLNREECEKILKARSNGKLELRNYEIVSANDARGFLGEYYRLILNCNEFKINISERADVKLTFFMKSLPLKTKEIAIKEIFQKEAELYATLIKDLQAYSTTVWCPRFYYNRSDLLVLEDLNESGYEKCCHNEENLTDVEFKATLNALAAMHACSILLEEEKGFKINENYSANILNDVTFSKDIPYFSIGLETIINLAKIHPLYQSKEMQHFITNELESHLHNVFEMVNTSKKYKNVFCHRDSWRANVLFNYKCPELKAALVDFQTCRYCPPCIDLLFTIFLNQGIESRKASEHEYILWYYEKLKLQLSQHSLEVEKILPLEELLNSYEDLKLVGFLYRPMAATILAVPDSLVTNDYKYVERTKTLLNVMEKNGSLHLYMENCVSELLECVLN